MKLQKEYVRVTSDIDATGYMHPRQITWKDGRIFQIESIRDFRPASMFSDVVGDCYTVIIQGQEKYLFFERFQSAFSGRLGRWFVEVP